MRKLPIVAGMLGLAAVAGTAYAVRRRRRKNTLRGRLDEATTEASDRANQVKDTAQETLSTVQERVVDLRDRAQEKIEEIRENRAS